MSFKQEPVLVDLCQSELEMWMLLLSSMKYYWKLWKKDKIKQDKAGMNWTRQGRNEPDKTREDKTKINDSLVDIWII